MTRRQDHLRDSAGFYLGIAGQGVLVIETRDGQEEPRDGQEREEMPPGRAVCVPPGRVHRTVNIGADDFIFSEVFLGDAGRDSAPTERSGFGMRITGGADVRPYGKVRGN